MYSFLRLTRTKFIVLAAAMIALGIFSYLFLKNKSDQLAPITVKKGAISQEVIVTGKIKPVSSVDLAFEKSGQVVSAGVKVGDRVAAGEIISELYSGDLNAQLLEAQANADSEKAQLAKLKSGARPEDLQISRTDLEKARQDLANDYRSALDKLNDAFAKADDAVHKQTDQLFTDSDQLSVQLAFAVTDSQAKTDVESKRYFTGVELKKWKNDLSQISATSSPSTLDVTLSDGKAHLASIYVFLNRLMDAVVSSIGIPASTLDADKANVNTARTNVNAAFSNLSALEQAVAAQKLTVKRAEDELTLKISGNTPEDIAAGEAQVKQAEAKIKEIQAQISKNILRAPISGLVTKQDAKTGEIATAGTPIVSIISDRDLQIEVFVPEVDIGKVSVGNSVKITLDALPGEDFSGGVTYIDPAETVIEGVVNFKVTISFERPDRRLKSGLTANLRVQTATKSDALILPQYAIVENDRGTFVRKIENGTIRETPVTIGIRSQDGFVEILSGVSEGEQVLNIGAKK